MKTGFTSGNSSASAKGEDGAGVGVEIVEEDGGGAVVRGLGGGAVARGLGGGVDDDVGLNLLDEGEQAGAVADIQLMVLVAGEGA